MIIAPIVNELRDLEKSGVSMYTVAKIKISAEMYKAIRACPVSNKYIDYRQLKLFELIPYEVYSGMDKEYEIILMTEH